MRRPGLTSLVSLRWRRIIGLPSVGFVRRRSADQLPADWTARSAHLSRAKRSNKLYRSARVHHGDVRELMFRTKILLF